jgi:translocation and assembly module TamB
MATVGNSNSRRSRPSDSAKPLRSDPVDDILSPPSRFGARKLLVVMFVLSLLGGILVLLGPTIIAHTALRDRVLNMAIGLDGDIDTARGSFGWFSPIVLEEVGVFDRDDTSVIEVESLTSDTTLLGLVMNPGNPGKFTIHHPVVNIVLREKGSNLEDVLRPLLTKKGSSSTSSVGVKITDGVVNIHDTVAKRKFQLQQVELDLAMDKTAKVPIELDASASMPTDGQRATMNVAVRGGSEDGGMEEGMIDCQVQAFPLEVVEPFVRRALPGAELTGLMAVNAHGTWGEGKDRKTMSLQGNAKVRDFALAADALGSDHLKLERIDLPCQITQSGDEIRIERLALKTDVGQMAIEGTLLAEDLNPSGLMTILQSEAYRLEGQLDLARLGQLLPNTLRIREGTEITDGQLQVVLVGEPRREGISWEGRVETTNLQAKANGKRVDWREPLTVEFAAHQTAEGPVVDRAKCTSNFLTLEGSGTLDDMQADGDFDLEKLVAEIERFVDLRDFELAGSGQAKLRWQRTGDDGFTTHADLQANNFALAAPGRRAWRERSVIVRLDADGRLVKAKKGWQLAGVEKAKLGFEAAGERLTAELLEPIEKLSGATVPVEIDWQGPLETWLARIDPWVSTVGWELSGAGILKATLVYGPEGVDVRKAVFASEPFRWTGGGLFIDERRLDAAVKGTWDSIARKLDVPNGTIEADTVLVKLSQATIKVPTAGPPTLMGTLKFDGDLAQINRWTQDPRQPSREMSGKLNGQAVVSRNGRDTAAKLTARIDDFAVAERAVRSGKRDDAGGWRERQLTLTATANYRDTDQILEIESAEIASSALRATLEGKIQAPADECLLDLAGTIDYDWQTLAPFWRPYVGDEVNIVGNESRKFMLRGPLPKTGMSLAGMLKPLTAEAGIGWQKAEAYGLPIGGGEIVARLDKGAIEIRPIDVAVSDGRFTLAPNVRVAPEPGEVRLGKGPVLTQVRFTPEITQRYLQYAMPFLAGTARIDGQFSFDLDGARLPLDNPKSGDLGGRVIIHSVQVTPGPMAEQFLSLGKQIEDLLSGRLPAFGQPSGTQSLLTVPEQQVEVRMVNGRIYHRGMQFVVGKIPLRTVGSVGLDNSLEMLAEFSIPTEGIGKGKLLDTLKGKTIQVPISGSLTNWKWSDSAVKQLVGQITGNVGKGLLLDEVGKQLDKFLPKQ